MSIDEEEKPTKFWMATRAYSTIGLYGVIFFYFFPQLKFMLTGQPSNYLIFGGGVAFFALFGLFGRFVRQPKKNHKRRKLIVAIMMLIAAVSIFKYAQPETSLDFDNTKVEAPVESNFDDRAEVIPINGALIYGSELENELFLSRAVPLIARWEGLRNEAYIDMVGVATICFGSTRGVELGMWFSTEQCIALLEEEILEYRENSRIGYTFDTIQLRLPTDREVAFTSLCYNVGVRGCTQSTAMSRLNDGDIPGACFAMTWWNKGTIPGKGRQTIPGLVRRRSMEQAYCLLKAPEIEGYV